VHLCDLYGYQNEERLFPYSAALLICFYNRGGITLLRGASWLFQHISYYAYFLASDAVSVWSALFWDVTQRRCYTA